MTPLAFRSYIYLCCAFVHQLANASGGIYVRGGDGTNKVAPLLVRHVFWVKLGTCKVFLGQTLIILRLIIATLGTNTVF